MWLDKPSKILEKLPKELAHVSALTLAPRLLREIAEPAPVGDSIKSAVTRAYRAVRPLIPEGPVRERFTYARAENLWCGEARRVDADEMDAIRAAHAERQRTFREEARAAGALAAHLECLAALAVDPRTLADADALRRTADEARKAALAFRRLAAADTGA